jgi:DNA-binding protein H-NS
MAVDIKNLNHNQLNDLISKAQERQTELRKEKVVKLREKIHSMIKAEGYSFDDIFGSSRGKARRSTGTVAPKYRNPGNPEQTWSGRGKRPRWFNDALAAGKKEKDLAI